MISLLNSIKHFKELTLILYNLFQETEEGKIFSNSLMKSVLPQNKGQCQTNEKKRKKNLETNIYIDYAYRHNVSIYIPSCI